MKYIRTEDKVYDGSLYLREYTGWYFHEKSKLYTFEEIDIIKEADTIKELCDGDVLFEDGQLKKVHYYNEGFGFNQYGSKLSTNQVVVLFIATKKGLIYVAKMNERGELELL